MSSAHASPDPHRSITVREALDFKLSDDAPRFWLDNDPFKTRFFDAMSVMFPPGEKFFIQCVREFRTKITDPTLQDQVKQFNRQEAQHSLVHRAFNDRLIQQGQDIDSLTAELEAGFAAMTRLTSAEHRLSLTAAMEHITSMMCTCLFERRAMMRNSDPHVRALYAWHAVEELEHKAVTFDVMVHGARSGYLRRVLGMLVASLGFPMAVSTVINRLLKGDGFSRWQRMKIWAGGVAWMWRPDGVFMPMLGHYFAYYRPNFHPQQMPDLPAYRLWVDTYVSTGDAVKAGEALYEAAR